MIFFLALFPQFVDPSGSVALQFVLMGLVSAAIEFPILVGYAILAGATARRIRDGWRVWIDGVAGATLIGIGVALATGKR